MLECKIMGSGPQFSRAAPKHAHAHFAEHRKFDGGGDACSG
jgi:hypothetical protein